MRTIKEYAGIISFLALIVVSITGYAYNRDMKEIGEGVNENKRNIEIVRQENKNDINELRKENNSQHANFITQKEADVIKELINRNYQATKELNKDIKELLKK